ncbi:hypothetical protein Tasa_046_027 [Tanticharoenia sakaeratensis NBRC 103193]|uniref:Nuclease n=2 Tax=Tanticharoenia TaxID=444052 RepID=A0A0D6MPN8_9PROT|nr:hypothetical protein Tasa_046_027 [Tanticharoenia sakaeratensis NBRC 103193]
MPIMKKLLLASAAFLAASSVTPALAWGGRAHTAIDRAAVDALPADGPVFLQRYVDQIGEDASVPDSWRGASEPFSKIAEDPNHGWFREQFAFIKDIPRSRFAFILALYRQHEKLVAAGQQADAARMNVRWTGTLPFAVAEGYGHLVADMRWMRKLQAEGKDTSGLQMACAFYVAWMGHYVGDGSQPLHVTIHHDGWVGPNPDGFTRDPKVHGQFESTYVDMIGLTEADVRAHMTPLAHQDGDVFNAMLAYLDRSRQDVRAVYVLDKAGAFEDARNKKARDMIYERTAAGASMLRDLLVRAWRESARPAAKVANPIDLSNPAYDPETGSAPAPTMP